MDAEAVAEIFIRRFYRQHGLPAIIISDRNRQFMNILWEKNMQNSPHRAKIIHNSPSTN